jgi:hypothetical protein
MPASPANFDAPHDRPPSGETHDVMCLVKRHTYELAFAVPHSPDALARGLPPKVYIRVKTPCRTARFSFDLADVERFHEDLLRMLEYMRSERQKAGISTPQ